MKIKAGIFDLGKVVVYSEDSVHHAYVQKSLGLTNEQINQVAKGIRDLVQTGQISEEEFLRKYLRENDLKTEFPKNLMQRIFKRDFRILEDTKTFFNFAAK